MILYLEQAHFKEHLDPKSLNRPELLTQLMPAAELARLPPGFDCGANVIERYQKFCASVDRRESRIVTMNRVFQYFQKSTLFGCYCWEGSLSTRPSNKSHETISDDRFRAAYISWAKKTRGGAPKQPPQVDEVKPQGDVVLAINFQEMAIYDRKSGDPVYRFAFADFAEERVVVWGGRGRTMQCLVLTKDDKSPIISPKRLNFSHPGATDAAYALDTLYKHAGWKR